MTNARKKLNRGESNNQGVCLSNVNIDNSVHTHNEELARVLLELARTQATLAEAVVSVSKYTPSVAQGPAVQIK